MSIRLRIFLGFIGIIGVGICFFSNWIFSELEPRYRELTEEPLVDAAQLLAAVASATIVDGQINKELLSKVFDDALNRNFSAQIYTFQKTKVDCRIYLTDSQGIVIFDSAGGRDEGKDYSGWRDVKLTLAGKYGARTSHDVADDSEASTMYVSAPVYSNGAIAGVLGLGKPTVSTNRFVSNAKKDIALTALLTLGAALAAALVISSMINRPLIKLADYARKVRDGKRPQLPVFSSPEISELGEAFEQMRESLEGKRYVENYVQTLTHEIKSPLAAIKGASELLAEDPPAERKQNFLANIATETNRIQALVEKLLLLSNLENRRELADREKLELGEVVSQVLVQLEPLVEQKQLSIRLDCDTNALFSGDRFFVTHALKNLVQNAIEFSPIGSSIVLSVKRRESLVEFVVCDSGPGIPDYAIGKIFDRFYSLGRPDTGKKSSGLGLSLVQEVAQLHSGSVELTNLPTGGTSARICFPSC